MAAINETTKEIIVLNTVRWKFFLEIDVDPSRELGQRARIVAPRDQKQPVVTQGLLGFEITEIFYFSSS